jgi:hypothetical protein
MKRKGDSSSQKFMMSFKRLNIVENVAFIVIDWLVAHVRF